MAQSIGKVLKKELLALGYSIDSVRVGEKSTGYAFVAGTKYKIITIKSEKPYAFTDEIVFKLILQNKLSSTISQAKSYTIVRQFTKKQAV